MKHFCPECCKNVKTPSNNPPADCIDHVPLDILLDLCEKDDAPHERMYRAMVRLHDMINTYEDFIDITMPEVSK